MSDGEGSCGGGGRQEKRLTSDPFPSYPGACCSQSRRPWRKGEGPGPGAGGGQLGSGPSHISHLVSL